MLSHQSRIITGGLDGQNKAGSDMTVTSYGAWLIRLVGFTFFIGIVAWQGWACSRRLRAEGDALSPPFDRSAADGYNADRRGGCKWTTTDAS
ncbi:MAG: hypothetical protein NZT92_08520 [Abditibacteriales bacterium]|nr:hypothetical protein [Abditibacteriales bacterium]